MVDWDNRKEKLNVYAKVLEYIYTPERAPEILTLNY